MNAWHSRFLVILVLAIVGCSKESPTAPTFDLAGTYEGYWRDLSVIRLDGTPLEVDFTLIVNEDGTASGGSEITVTIRPQQQATISVLLDLIVLPDGSISGTGSYSCCASEFEVIADGEVVGQFDVKKKTASGLFPVSFGGTTICVDWQVSRIQ